MANPCIITYKGKEYSTDEFSAMLHDGLLDQFIEEKAIDASKFGKASYTDTIIDALERAKIDTSNSLNAFGLLPETWNAILSFIQKSIKAGKTFNEAITEAYDKYKSSIENIDKKGFENRIQEIYQAQSISIIKNEKGELVAPNGEKSNLSEDNWRTVRTKAFKEWSSNWESVIKDENGEPQLMYHGSKRQFSEFNRGANWVTPKKSFAEQFAKSSRFTKGKEVSAQVLYRTFIKLENPIDVGHVGVRTTARKILSKNNIDDSKIGEILNDSYNDENSLINFYKNKKGGTKYLKESLDRGWNFDSTGSVMGKREAKFDNVSEVWSYFDKSNFTNALKNNGIDGLIGRESPNEMDGDKATRTYATFNPNNLWITNEAKTIEDSILKGKTEIQKMINALNSLKIDTKGTLNAFGVGPEIWNAAMDVMIATLRATQSAADAIKAAKEYIQSSKDKDKFDESAFMEKMNKDFRVNEKTQAQTKSTDNEVKIDSNPLEPKIRTRKKSLLNRAYEGTTNQEVKEAISEHGLDYEIESHAVAKAEAKAFVYKVGAEAALDAVRKNQIEDGAAAFVWAEIIDEVHNEIATTENEEQKADLIKLESDLMAEFDRKARSGGRFISALGEVYRSSDFGYSASRQIDTYKANNNGVIPAEIEQKFKDLEVKLKETTNKIAELEKQLEEEKQKEAIGNIQESIERETAEAKKEKSIKQKAKDLADKIRKGKTARPNVFLSTSPGAIAWDTAVELAAKSIELSGDIAQAIQSGLKHIRETEWYKNLDRSKQKEAEAAFVEFLDQSNGKEVGATVVNGKIKIPHALIREKVAQGITEPNELTKAIYDELKGEYPDITERQVRDAISSYGKTSNPSQEEIEVQIRKIKRIDRIISSLEDVAEKKRPLRSGRQRDKLDAEERALNKQLKEAMKELPKDVETTAQQLKTSLDAVKSRLKNQIEDIERQIQTGEKSAKAASIPYDQEAKELLAERDRLAAIRDEIFGDKELTDEQKIENAIKATEREISKLNERIANNDLEVKKQGKISSPELEAVRARLSTLKATMLQMQQDAGIPQKKKLESTKNRVRKQMIELQRKIANKDFTKKAKPQPVTDDELNQLRANKIGIQNEFDKLQYANQLKNRTKAEKIWDGIVEAWNLTRALRATSEFSFMLLQGGVQTIAHPMSAAKAFINMWSHFASETRADKWLASIQAQPYYPRLKASKLALTEHDAKLNAREELFLSGWLNHVWDIAGMPFKLVSQKAYETWKKLNPSKAFERAATGYLNTLRVERYLQGEGMLNLQGKTFETHPDDYKAMADVINTFTGRGSLGPLEMVSKPLSLIFFSPRMWAATIKQITPYAFVYLGKKHSKGEAWYKPSVAQKMAMADYMKYITLTTAIVMSAKANEEDNEREKEKGLSVSMDPTSSDFMKIKIGKTRVDPWGSRQQMIVLQSRLILDAITKKGKRQQLGTGPYIPTRGGIVQDYAKNKLAPSTSILYKYAFSKIQNVDGVPTRTDGYGNKISLFDQTTDNLYPIYWETFKELNQEQPGLTGAFLNALAFMGVGTQTYEDKSKNNAKK